MTTSVTKSKPTEVQGSAAAMDENRVVVIGENQYMKLSEKDGDPFTSEVSLWRNHLSPAGAGHALFLKSELTQGQWRIYSDNIAMVRWLQKTVQGMLSADTKDPALPVVEASFTKVGNPPYFWTEHIVADGIKIVGTWSEFLDPILVHTRPNDGPTPRPYGVCTILVPTMAAQLTINGARAKGQAWPRDRMGRPYGTCGLGLAESWTEPR